MKSIQNLIAVFSNNPQKSYAQKDFKEKNGWNHNSIKVWFKRLKKRNIIKQLNNKKYILADRNKALEALEKNSYKSSSTSMIPPHRIRGKAHYLQAKYIDLSGEPIEWMLKLNMLTKPGSDPAQNVGLRKDIAKKFNMRISLQNPTRAIIYPKDKGWDEEFLNLFSWCGDIINRLGAVKPNMEMAINYEDLQKIKPELRDIPFEAIQGFEIYHNGMHIQLCRSQFPEGEICIRADTIEETMSLTDKITYGGRNISQAMRETAFEKRIYGQLQSLEQLIKDLPFALTDIITNALKEAVRDGIKEGFNDLGPIKKDEKRDVT